MKRLFLLFLALATVPGCCGSQSGAVSDPFFGYNRVPPPATGCIYGQSADPYYPGAPNSMAPMATPPGIGAPNTLPPNTGTFAPVTPGMATPRWMPPDGGSSRPPGPSSGTPRSGNSQTPAGSNVQPPASSGNNRYAPPGGNFNYQGNPPPKSNGFGFSSAGTRVPAPSFTNRVTTQPAGNQSPQLTNAGPQSADDSQGNAANREPVIQVLQPRPKALAVSKSTQTPSPAESPVPRRMHGPERAIDIMDLPDPSGSTTPDRTHSQPATNGFRLVSGTQSSSDSGKVVAAVATSADVATIATDAKYGHDPQYGWLRGKLEHSQIDGCWKLRYIPIDGATDDFGGSVILPDRSILSGVERGDFIEVRGKIGKHNAAKGFAPAYEVSEIKRTPR